MNAAASAVQACSDSIVLNGWPLAVVLCVVAICGTIFFVKLL